MSEHLSPSDHALAQKAHQDLVRANGIWEFAHNHLVNTYQIQPGDSVDISTGAITRSEEVGRPGGNPEEPKPEKKARVKKPAKAEVTD